MVISPPQTCTALNNGGVIMRSGASPKRRLMLYHEICIPARLTLMCIFVIAAVAFQGSSAAATATISFVMLLGALVAVIANLIIALDPGCRWWCPAANVGWALLAAVGSGAAFMGYVSPEIAPLSVAVALYGSIMTGFTLSGVYKPFSKKYEKALNTTNLMLPKSPSEKVTKSMKGP